MITGTHPSAVVAYTTVGAVHVAEVAHPSYVPPLPLLHSLLGIHKSDGNGNSDGECKIGDDDEGMRAYERVCEMIFQKICERVFMRGYVRGYICEGLQGYVVIIITLPVQLVSSTRGRGERVVARGTATELARGAEKLSHLGGGYGEILV